MKKAFLSLLAGLLPWTLASTAAASMPEIPTLHIETYSSPSQEWKLEVDPTHREGSGPGRYRMTREGKEVWAAELPVTLQHAELTDTGITVGFGYSHGEPGFGNNGPGTLNTLLIDPRGGVLLDDAVPRNPVGMPGVWPQPTAYGVLLHPEADRFILQLDSPGKSWRVYQLSTGKKLDAFDLRTTAHIPDTARSVFDARPLTGVPLVLVQWWLYENDESGALFSIVDFKGRSVWSHSLPRDYSIPGDEKAETRLKEEIGNEGGILAIGEAGSFALRQAAEGTRADFKIARDDSAETGWTVTKTSSKPYMPKKESEPGPKDKVAPPLLPVLGRFDLQDRPSGGAIYGILEFDFDGQGHFGFLRRDPASMMSFVIVDSQAAVLAEIPLPKQNEEKKVEKEKENDTETMHVASLGGTRWIVATSRFAEGAKSRAWWIDAEKRSIDEIAGFDAPSIEKVRGTPDGGFVVLATHHQEYSSTDFMIRFDATGKQAWKHEARGDTQPSSLFSPEDLTVTTRGEIAVLDNIRKTVQWFALDGSHLRTTALANAWKHDPNYPTDITPDAAGGVIVHDFNGTPPFVRMRPDGAVSGELSPKRGDGRVIDADTGLRAAPDSTLWACDGDSFIQLSDQGLALRDIGSTADDDKLGAIAAVTADAEGTLHAMDRRTAAVHVFGPDGAKLRVCKPAKDDFPGHISSTHLTVTHDGGLLVLMKEDDEKRERYLAFGPDGSRKGIKQLGLDDITEEWYCQPRTGNILVLGYHEVYLVDPADKLFAKIERQADRRWFEYLSGAAFAADGSFVINSTSGWEGENHLTFFDATGKPLTTIRPDTDAWATLGGNNGRHITLATEHVVRVHDRHGKVIAATPKNEENFTHLLARGGKELWVIEHVSHTVTRYAMPE